MTEYKEQDFIKIEYSYTDQWGQETKYSKTISIENLVDCSELELLVQEFKTFCKSTTGYLDKTIDKAIIFKNPDN